MKPDWAQDKLVARVLEIAAQAGEIARSYFRAPLGVDFKADESPVTIADRNVETLIRNALMGSFPADGILGEEHGTQAGDSDAIWIIDPIDGTRSFISGHPLFGMLIGRLEGGVPALGVIGMPALDEVFVGMPGHGALLNDRPIRVSEQRDLTAATLFINEGEKIFADHEGVFRHLVSAGQTRRFTYDCYPHALLAAGHVDVVVDYDLQPYDYLPVAGVVQGAGGIMTDWQGRPLGLKSDGRVVSAATPELHAQVLELLRGGAT